MRAASLLPFQLLLLLPASLDAQALTGTYRGNDQAGLRAALERDPGNHGLRIRLNQALLRREPSSAHPDAAKARLQEAEGNFSRILEENPRSPLPLRVLALDASVRRDFDGALAYGLRYLEVVPHDQEVIRLVIRCLFRAGRIEDAAERLWIWISASAPPGFGSLQGQFATLCLNEEFRTAFERRLDAGILGSPKDSAFHLYRAVFLLETGRTESAWGALHGAEAAGLCDLRTGLRHPFAAILLARTPEYTKAPGSMDDAGIEQLESASRQHPEHLGLLMRLARRLDILGRRDEAVALYREAFDRNPALFAAAFRAGELCLEAGEVQRACEHLEAAAKTAGARYPAALLAAKARAMLKDGAAVRDLLVPSMGFREPGPETREVLDLLGTGAGPVVDELERLVGLEPGRPFLLAHLALAQHAAGLKDKARAMALRAERAGFAGQDGFPAALLFHVHDEPLPKEMANAPRR